MKRTLSTLLIPIGATLAAQACTKQLDPTNAPGAALDVNDSGIAVGWSATTPAGSRSAISYAANGTRASLGKLPDDVVTEARSIADDGTVVGSATSSAGQTRAVYWDSSGAIHSIPSASPGVATAINNTRTNDDGTIVGFAGTSAGPSPSPSAVKWTPAREFHWLEAPDNSSISRALAINAHGSIVGELDGHAVQFE
jgi:uncharacterized membrane protein